MVRARPGQGVAKQSTPEASPKTLVARYGPSNGFGWKLNETLGVQVVSVRQAGGAVIEARDELLLAPGDTLVLSGLPEALALAEEKLLQG
jgi:hypothetical protein